MCIHTTWPYVRYLVLVIIITNQYYQRQIFSHVSLPAQTDSQDHADSFQRVLQPATETSKNFKSKYVYKLYTHHKNLRTTLHSYFIKYCMNYEGSKDNLTICQVLRYLVLVNYHYKSVLTKTNIKGWLYNITIIIYVTGEYVTRFTGWTNEILSRTILRSPNIEVIFYSRLHYKWCISCNLFHFRGTQEAILW